MCLSWKLCSKAWPSWIKGVIPKAHAMVVCVLVTLDNRQLGMGIQQTEGHIAPMFDDKHGGTADRCQLKGNEQGNDGEAH